MPITVQQAMQWEAFVSAAVSLGVKTWSVIHAAMHDAGVTADDATILTLKAKFDALRADVARAAGQG